MRSFLKIKFLRLKVTIFQKSLNMERNLAQNVDYFLIFGDFWELAPLFHWWGQWTSQTGPVWGTRLYLLLHFIIPVFGRATRFAQISPLSISIGIIYMVSQSNTEIKVDISAGCMILKSDDIGLLFTLFKIEKKWRLSYWKYYKIIL